MLERVKHESGPEAGVVVLLGSAAGLVGEGGCLRAGKDGKGEELFCAGAGGGRVGWEVLKLLTAHLAALGRRW